MSESKLNCFIEVRNAVACCFNSDRCFTDGDLLDVPDLPSPSLLSCFARLRSALNLLWFASALAIQDGSFQDGQVRDFVARSYQECPTLPQPQQGFSLFGLRVDKVRSATDMLQGEGIDS